MYYRHLRKCPLELPKPRGILYSVYMTQKNKTMKNYKVQVETNDGRLTWWYEKSSAKKASSIICDRVCKQLFGLDVRRVEVSLEEA